MDNLTKLAKQMRCGLYVDFGTDLESAFNAANILAGSSREPAAVFTALYGVINTLCNVIEQEANNVSGLVNEMECRAYANGALDGYNTGDENNPYEDENTRLAYRTGYDYGVHLYCQDTHGEE